MRMRTSTAATALKKNAEKPVRNVFMNCPKLQEQPLTALQIRKEACKDLFGEDGKKIYRQVNNMFNYLPAACHFGVKFSAFASRVQQLKQPIPAGLFLVVNVQRSLQSLVTLPSAAMAALGQASYLWPMSACWMRTSPSRWRWMRGLDPDVVRRRCDHENDHVPLTTRAVPNTTAATTHRQSHAFMARLQQAVSETRFHPAPTWTRPQLTSCGRTRARIEPVAKTREACRVMKATARFT